MENKYHHLGNLSLDVEQRGQILTQLFQDFLGENLSVAIVKSQWAVFRDKTYEKIKLKNSASKIIYVLKSFQEIFLGVECLLAENFWHKGKFYLIVFNKDIMIKQADDLKKMLNDIEQESIGYVEPLDGDLYFTGTVRFKEVLDKINCFALE